MHGYLRFVLVTLLLSTMAGRTVGSKNSCKSTRKQSTTQQRLQSKKCQETKEKNAELKRNKNKAKFMKSLFRPGGQNTVADTTDNSDEPDPSSNPADNIERNDCENNDNDGEYTVVVVNHPTPTVINPPNIEPNLDYDEDEAAKKESDDSLDGKQPGIQQTYVEAVQKRVQTEVSKDFKGIKWLVPHLEKNEWWIRKDKSPAIIRMLNAGDDDLNLKRGHQAYYRDVFVWLPDIRWPDNVKRTFVPCCPNCKTNDRVGPHCFRNNHSGRLIVGLEETYYCITRRYKCSACEEVAQQAKAQVEAFAKDKNLKVDVEVDDESSYTFMGWDQRVLPLLPYGKGNKFPAFLTWRAGVDKQIVKMLRPLHEGGMRPERVSDLLLELHSLKFDEDRLEHENEIKRTKSTFTTAGSCSHLGDFGDKLKYRGTVPTGQYLGHVYKKYHSSISEHLEKEVKKRGAETIHWDVSYKEAKHLCRYRGRPVYKGLVTGLNSIGEVRFQFHIYTDSHEQMTGALQAFKRTTASLGLPDVKLFFTDNPAGDQGYFMDMLPSLEEQQNKFDALCAGESASTAATSTNEKPFYDFDSLKIRYPKKDEIDKVVTAMMVDMGEKKIVGNRIHGC